MVNAMVKPGKFLTFILKEQTYGVRVADVREINQFHGVTPIPQTPKFVAGVMKYSGHAIPVVNMREKFGMEPSPSTKQTCTIVVDSGNGLMAVIVDSISAIVDLATENIDPTPRLGDNTSESIILGIGRLGDAVIILVDIAKSLSEEHLAQVVSLGLVA
jgi:purine-binding chemotaxis protein CheW